MCRICSTLGRPQNIPDMLRCNPLLKARNPSMRAPAGAAWAATAATRTTSSCRTCQEPDASAAHGIRRPGLVAELFAPPKAFLMDNGPLWGGSYHLLKPQEGLKVKSLAYPVLTHDRPTPRIAPLNTTPNRVPFFTSFPLGLGCEFHPFASGCGRRR